MKKQLFLMSALALTALTSCGGGAKRYVPGTKLKVGLICLHDEASTYDNNFISAFKAAVETSRKAGYVVDEDPIIRTDVAEDQACGDTAKQLVNQGCNIIFSDSFGHDDYMYQAALDNPNVIFSGATGIKALTGGADNYHNAFASIYEGRFLAGVAAGMYLRKNCAKDMTKPFNIGYVGAYPYAEVISGYTSWFLGVKYALSSIIDTDYSSNLRMKVVYTNSWYSEADERTAAEKLIKDDHCILISQHADSMGAPNACAAAGIPNISYNMDTRKAGQTGKTYLGHSRINWQPYYENVIKSTFEGRTIKGEVGRNYTGSLLDGSVKYALNEDIFDVNETGDPNKIPTTVIDAAALGLETGTLHVFDIDTFTVKNLDKKYDPKDCPKKGTDYDCNDSGYLTKFMGDTTGDYVRDTNLLETDLLKQFGWIAESSVRSAPSFDLIIDGINEPAE